MPKATSGKSEARSPNDECNPTDSIVRLSILVACASVLQVAESLLPHPLPGVRLGLANIITVIAIVYIGPGSAVQLAVLRTLVSSMVLGTFLTPTFVLSFSGGVVSALVMVLLYRLSRGGGPFRFSLIGISVGGAVSHILTQVALVYLLFIRSSGVLLLWPWLALSAVVTGVVTGMIAVQAVRRLDAGEASGAVLIPVSDRPDVSDWSDQDTGIRRLRPELKIAAVVVLGLAVVIFSSYALYAGVLLLLAVVTALARVRLSRLFVGLKRIWALLVAALVMPVVFSPWGRMLFGIGPVRVTDQGLHEGAIFAARILLLFFATALLAQTTAPREVAGGLEKLLAPLRVFRVRPGRLAQSLSLSWFYFPQFWQSVRRMVGESRGRKGWLDRTIHLPGDVVADLYFAADRLAGSGPEEPGRQPETGGFPPPPDRQ
ncbi:MAG: Gx transporter family protein [candidate division WOR-3 bacterium]|nr:Gx transporter family protein [candidate division WOR-3 bacterium]